MSSGIDYARRLQTALRQLAQKADVTEVPRREPLEQLIHAFLWWENTRNQADKALAELFRHVVDPNELRVCDPLEILEFIGEGYAGGRERADRLKRVLNAIYLREHAVSLAGLAEKNKKAVREYLDGLEGMPPFVSAVVQLLVFGGHAVPVDDMLLRRMAADLLVDPSWSIAQAQSFLEQQIRAEKGLESFLLLRAYVERPIRVDLPKVKLPRPKSGPQVKVRLEAATKSEVVGKPAAKAPVKKSPAPAAKKPVVKKRK